MTENICARVGDWYKDSPGRLLQVILYNENDDYIEVRLFEGEDTEFDLNSWNQLEIELVEPSEDWSGPFDDLVADEISKTEKAHASN